MTRMKSVFAVFLLTAVAGIVPQAHAQTTVKVVIAGSSAMWQAMALAAYNSGTTTVKRAVSRNVRDPINQRSFWYLYRARALPRETREFVPRVFAAILIGRNPQHFGFDRPSAQP